jgi:hypothetical protein
VLLILPAFAFFRAAPRERALLAAGFCAFLAAALALHAGMNTTPAQAAGIYAEFDAVRLRNIAQTFVTGIFIGLAFLSGFEWLLGSEAVGHFRGNLVRPWVPAAASVLFLLLPVLGRLPLVEWQAPFIGSMDRSGHLQVLSMLAVLPLLWILDWKALRIDAPLCLCAGYIAINGLKGRWFDIYALDVGLAALFAALSRDVPRHPGRPVLALAAAALGAHLLWAYGFKIQADKHLLSNRVYEKLERQGKIGVDGMTDATFGYLGWKLLDHYLAETGGEGRDAAGPAGMGGFVGYVGKDRVVLETELPWRRAFRRSVPEGAEILEAGTARAGFFDLRYRAMDLRSGASGSISPFGAFSLDKRRYARKPFPLDKDEWDRYIRLRLQGAGSP